MASYFGEVIHPTSRAFWTEDDDEETIDSGQETVDIKKILIKDVTFFNSDFNVIWHEPEPSQIENFLIIEGEMVIDFVSTCILENVKNVCSIMQESEKNCTNIYLIGDFYICTISTKLNLAQAGQLTETIGNLLSKSKFVFALTSDHISHFKSEEEVNSASFLKALYSTKAKSNKSSKISALSQPNIVTGVCAGVLSYAEIVDLHCVMYILYTDTFTLDSENALPLTALLSELLKKTLPNFTIITSSFFNKGNLYM